MKRLLILGLVLMMAGGALGATSRNMYSVARTNYTTSETTVTFPYESECFIVINYDTATTLEVTIGTTTAEVDPRVGPTLEFNDFGVTSIVLGTSLDGSSAEAGVIVLY